MTLQSLRRWGIALVVASAVLAVPVAYAVQSGGGATGQIGTGQVALDESELATPDLIRAFVRTDSQNPGCLVTFGDSTIGRRIDGPAFCAPRTVNGVDGVLITIFLGEEVADLSVSLTVYQQFAKQYGTPVLYTGT